MNTFLKFLSRNKLYTAINIFGFAVSLMFVLLIADYTVRQLTTDNFQEKADRIYVLGTEEWIGSAYKLSDDLVARYPEIEAVCAYSAYYNPAVEIEGVKSTVKAAFVDSCFFDLFSFKLIEGSYDNALESKESVIVTESFAKKTWGSEDPMGKSIKFTSEEDGVPHDRVITGVMQDIDNSVVQKETEILLRADNLKQYNASLGKDNYNNAAGVILFILARENADLPSKREDMKTFFKEFYWIYRRGAAQEVTLTPLRKVIFSDLMSYQGLNHNNKSFVYILMEVGIAILFFAIVNYINLTVAQTSMRAKEMATRRLLGANKMEIVLRFISEAIILCFFSFFIAFVLALLTEPYAAQLLQSPISVMGDLSTGRIVIYVTAILLLGIISGVVPALVIARYKPIDVVKGSFKLRSKLVFSKVFIVFQNVITIALIASAITISSQIKHLTKAPLGYEYQHIIDVKTSSGFTGYEQMKAFKNEVAALSCVDEVAFSSGTPHDGGNNNTISFGEDAMISFQILYGDSTYFDMLKFEKLRDNHLASGGAYINEQAVKEMEIPMDAPEFKIGPHKEWTYSIAGVYKNFQVRSEIGKKYPVMIYNIGDYDSYRLKTDNDYSTPWNILIKVNGDEREAFDRIAAIFNRLTDGEVFKAQYIEEQINEDLKKEDNLLSIINIFTLIAVVISALGLLAMSTFFIQQRKMEIAVRKVFGSTNNEILGKLVSTFLRSVLVAFVLAVPVIWYVMDSWLKSYIYKIKLTPIIFIAAGAFAVTVATITVFYQSLRAANTNPAIAIRS